MHIIKKTLAPDRILTPAIIDMSNVMILEVNAKTNGTVLHFDLGIFLQLIAAITAANIR